MSTAIQESVVSIVDPKDIDLNAHALIEASAGTGKTYTIENLVVRLLMEDPDILLEEILLVTFTEKATSELKQRIREKIEGTLNEENHLTQALREKLHGALDGFDNAAIFTIHGFCHSLLREFPFETGNLFEQEMIDDAPLFEKLLREEIRKNWPRRYGERLKDLLRLSPFSSGPDRFVSEIAGQARRLSGDPSRETFIPDPYDLDIDALWESARETTNTLKSLVAGPPTLSESYARLNIGKPTKAKILRDLVEPLERALSEIDGDAADISPVISTIQDSIDLTKKGAEPFDGLIPKKWLKAGENLDVCPHLPEIKNHLDALTRMVTTVSHALAAEALIRLPGAVKAVKARNGWIGFQDMLSRVADFLARPDAADGLEKIRKRYRVAFVDEFQDTDDLQWRIFNTLFMQTGSVNRLFLIGDPKQAIYGFRGADIFTYLDARRTLTELASRNQAHLYRLDTNYRSLPAMVGGFNQFFGQATWFGREADKGPFDIGYPPSGSPDEQTLPMTLAGDESGRPAVNIVDLSAIESQKKAQPVLADFICDEIQRLVETADIRLRQKTGEIRPLGFKDVAILVRSQGEFLTLEKSLAQAGIPYTYYRQPGLFQSRQAHWLAMVLKAVVRPMDMPTVRLALLTPFFDLAPQRLADWPELPADHISRRLLAHWQNEAFNKRWGRLFQSLMEASGLTTRHCTDPDWDRTQTNLRQLFDYLEAVAYEQNTDIDALVAHLDNLRSSGSAAGTDADIHQIEDEGDKVQVLTMHVSKGLEFPVVFIAGGLTTRALSGMRTYHHIDPDDETAPVSKIIDLTGRTGVDQAAKEAEDENKRLYYVALTRARMKIYVPFYPDERKYGWIGPICKFVSQSIQAAMASGGDGEGDEAASVGWLDPLSSEVPKAVHAPGEAPGSSGAESRCSADDLLPPQTDFRHRKTALESFSSIGHRLFHHQSAGGPQNTFQLIDEMDRDDDEPVTALTIGAMADDPAAELPGGANMGSLFHHIFENMDFQKALDGPQNLLDDPALSRVIESAVTRYRVDEKWMPAIGDIVARTLRTPIDLQGRALRMGALIPETRRHEIEFFFPFLNPFSRGQGRDTPQKLIIRGFIDLVFKWNDRFYIADWKSNRLADGYDHASMDAEMRAAGYDLQYQIYCIAALRWLRQRLGERFEPNHHFGGVLYLFIRGMNDACSGGVYHVPPEALLPLDALETTVNERIATLF